MLRKHANDLFLKLQTLRFMDLLDFKTTQIIYKAKNKLLPKNVQRWFRESEKVVII